METITFYSYKGGTGRTLVVANVARYLSRFAQTVVVLDFDLEAPGLHYKLNLGKPGEGLSVERGVVDYFHASFLQGSAPESLKGFFIPLELSPTERGPIYLMAAGNVPSIQYWEKLSQINWHQFLYTPGALGVPRFLELKERIREEFKPDFLLIDARTGITEIGGVATAILPDKVVCLLLNNRENLDGARAVLRSLRRVERPPGLSPVEVIPVLARIPAFDEQGEESRLVDRVRSFLAEPAEELQDTIAVSDLFVLHSERDLEVNECLRIGGNKSPDESVLLRDYLRLFLRLVKPEVIRPHLSPLIEQAKRIAFDDPDRAQTELELLAEYGHPDAYRELLKFYRLRKAEAATQLRAAQRYWEVARQVGDPVLWQCIKENFKEQSPGRSRDPRVDLGFVEEVWRGAGADDVAIGCTLAESLDSSGAKDRAADLLLALVENTGSDPTAVTSCLRQLRRAGRWTDVKRIIDARGPSLGDHPGFLEELARYVIETRDTVYLRQVSAPRTIELLRRNSPAIAYELMLAVGDDEGAESTLNQAIQQCERLADIDTLVSIADAYIRRNGREEFERRFRTVLPEELFDRLRIFLRRRR
ncbi:MAG: hypothetical protein NTY19_19880 [Planctomycetota bacterium]|nr:hypothetical protein [Planctomycetota bacterium]